MLFGWLIMELSYLNWLHRKLSNLSMIWTQWSNLDTGEILNFIQLKFFHTCHNLIWYSAIVHKLTSLFNLWTNKTIHVNLCKNWVIDLKKNNLYRLNQNMRYLLKLLINSEFKSLPLFLIFLNCPYKTKAIESLVKNG